MRVLGVIVGAAVCLCWQSAQADMMDDLARTRELAQIIGTAEICGYVLDEAKTAEKASSMLSQMETAARAMFGISSDAHKHRMKDMPDIERKTICATQKKMAEKYGMTP